MSIKKKLARLVSQKVLKVGSEFSGLGLIIYMVVSHATERFHAQNNSSTDFHHPTSDSTLSSLIRNLMDQSSRTQSDPQNNAISKEHDNSPVTEKTHHLGRGVCLPDLHHNHPHFEGGSIQNENSPKEDEVFQVRRGPSHHSFAGYGHEIWGYLTHLPLSMLPQEGFAVAVVEQSLGDFFKSNNSVDDLQAFVNSIIYGNAPDIEKQACCAMNHLNPVYTLEGNLGVGILGVDDASLFISHSQYNDFRAELGTNQGPFGLDTNGTSVAEQQVYDHDQTVIASLSNSPISSLPGSKPDSINASYSLPHTLGQQT